MSVTANRHCIVCGDNPPFDDWMRVGEFDNDNALREAWVHRDCVSRLVNCAMRLQDRRNDMDKMDVELGGYTVLDTRKYNELRTGGNPKQADSSD